MKALYKPPLFPSLSVPPAMTPVQLARPRSFFPFSGTRRAAIPLYFMPASSLSRVLSSFLSGQLLITLHLHETSFAILGQLTPSHSHFKTHEATHSSWRPHSAPRRSCARTFLSTRSQPSPTMATSATAPNPTSRCCSGLAFRPPSLGPTSRDSPSLMTRQGGLRVRG